MAWRLGHLARFIYLQRKSVPILLCVVCCIFFEGSAPLTAAQNPSIVSWLWPPNGAVLWRRPFQIRLEFKGLIDDRQYILNIFMNSTLASRSEFYFDSLEGITTVATAPALHSGPLLIEAEVWDKIDRHSEPLEGSFIEVQISDSWPEPLDSPETEQRFSSVQCTGGTQQAIEMFSRPRRVCMFSDVCWARGSLVYFSDPELDQHVPQHSSLWALQDSLLKVAPLPPPILACQGSACQPARPGD